MKRLTPFLLLFCATGLFAVSTNERTTLTLTVTNVPVTGDSFTFNATLRNWTNADSASTILTNLQGPSWATTNLFNNILSYSYAGGPWISRYSGTNIIQIVSPVGSPITATAIGTWCTIVYSTQQVVRLRSVLYPFNGLIDSNAIDQASEIVTGINTSSTNAFATNAVAMGNFVRKTNSYATNIILQSPKFTNAINYGNALSSPGTYVGSEQFGSGSLAGAGYATAVGNAAIVTGYRSVAIGASSAATAGDSIAIGQGAEVTDTSTNGIALGRNSTVSATNGMTLGMNAVVSHENSMAIGIAVVSTRTNEIRLGGSQDVVVGGLLNVAGQFTNNDVRITGGSLTNVAGAFSVLDATNLTARSGVLTNVSAAFVGLTATNLQAHAGTLTNVSQDRNFSTNITITGASTLAAGGNLALPASVVTTIADGHNVLDVGSNAFVRLTPSPTAAWQLGGIVGDIRNGRNVVIENATGFGMLVLNESGTTPTASQRITCGASFLIGSGGMVSFVYDSTATRWKVISSHDALGQQGLLFVNVTTNFNGTNWAPLTTNIPAGYYPLGAFAQLSSAGSNYLVLSGATADYTNVFASAPAERITTNAMVGSLSAGTLVNVYAGYYLVNASLTVWGEVDNSGDEVELQIFLNGIAQANTEAHATLATGVKTTISTSSLVYMPSATTVTARIRNESDATSSLPVIQTRLQLDSP